MSNYNIDTELVKNNPEWLSHKTVTGELPTGSLVIENAVIKKTTFIDFSANESIFKNVVFEDCRFIKVSAWGCLFENITFKSGLMTNNGDPYYESNHTDFRQATFRNVAMDGLRFGHVNLRGIDGDGTRLLLINMNMKRIPYFILGVENMHVRIKNCDLQGDGEIVLLNSPGSVYATDSYFDGTGFECRADVAYVENCRLLNGASIGYAKTTVIKDSVVSGPIGGGGSDTVYLINNTYPEGIGLGGLESTKIYLDGRNKKIASINIAGGGAYIKDLELMSLGMRRLAGYRNGVEVVEEPYTLDLNNVIIRGGNFYDTRLRGGRWQDVKLYPPIKVPNTQLKNVQTYQVTFPEGSPWTEASTDTSIELIKSPAPFDFPEIKAPTPQELGLID